MLKNHSKNIYVMPIVRNTKKTPWKLATQNCLLSFLTLFGISLPMILTCSYRDFTCVASISNLKFEPVRRCSDRGCQVTVLLGRRGLEVNKIHQKEALVTHTSGDSRHPARHPSKTNAQSLRRKIEFILGI